MIIVHNCLSMALYQMDMKNAFSGWALWSYLHAPSTYSLHFITTCLSSSTNYLWSQALSLSLVGGLPTWGIVGRLYRACWSLSLSGFYSEKLCSYLVVCRWYDHYWWWCSKQLFSQDPCSASILDERSWLALRLVMDLVIYYSLSKVYHRHYW